MAMSIGEDLIIAKGFVKLAANISLKTNVALSYKERTVNAKNIMQSLSIGIKAGEEVEIVAKGADAQEAVDTLEAFIENGF